ncbi:5-formyltetrahydrofolate cyclo-ligase [Microbulbifer sp. S227A]|uniref:5-formyltetrahydrofolate cyclo-ligase n=1 Tax=Microbulbifer sp. S227A TaxID=3415131 RepID=UPI003C7E6529
MGKPSDNPRGQGGYASSPCMAAQVAPDYFDPLAVDPAQARDVARWRQSERRRLREMRKQIAAGQRGEIARALMAGLAALLEQWDHPRCVSFYWPIKDEPDLRPLMHALGDRGYDIALPLVETRAAPLVFRRWTPQTRMVRGHWNIPVPPPDAPELRPDVVLAPLVGWADGGYRLGYGGGYFDRTLAASDPRPRSIGVGLQSARLATIYPQPHDIALDLILTEAGVQAGQGDWKGSRQAGVTPCAPPPAP